MVGSLAITGGIAGYHFSQVPGEGPLIYDHGVLWVFLMLFLYILSRRIYDKSKVTQVAGNTTVLHMGYREHVLIKEETAAREAHHKVLDMTNTEEQQMIHAISGLAQGVNALLKLFGEINEQRAKADEEMINLLKLISRKH